MNQVEEEINLYPYVGVLLRSWWLILVSGLVMAGVAAGISLTAPITYEAAGAVGLGKSTVGQPARSKVVIDLATSDSVVSSLQQALAADPIHREFSLADLRRKLKVTPSSDSTTLTLTVRDENQNWTSKATVAWAQVLVQAMEKSDQARDADNAKRIDADTRAAMREYQFADAELSDHNGDEIQILEAQIGALGRVLNDLAIVETKMKAISAQAQALRDRLRQSDEAAVASPLDRMITTQLFLTALSETPRTQANHALPFDSGITNREQLTAIENLIEFAAYSLTEAEKQVAKTQDDLRAATSRLRVLREDQAPLIARKNGAQRILDSLSTERLQLTVASGSISSQLQIISPSPVSVPLPRGTTRNVVLGATLGLTVGAMAVLARGYRASRRGSSVGPTLQDHTT